MELIMPVLKVSSSWDSAKLSDCVKLLFREILVPTYSIKDTSDKFIEFFKRHIYPALDKPDFSKRGLAASFEQLFFVHSYVHTLFETNTPEEFEVTIQAVLPPLFTLDNILRHCTDIVLIKEACTKDSDLPTALTFARLASF